MPKFTRIHEGRTRPRSGFTLIELLVVISIIVTLMGLAMVALTAGRTSGQETAVKNTIQMISAAITQFETKFGDFPPTTLQEIGVKGNDINQGNESLFAWLMTKEGGPFGEFSEEKWANIDSDSVTKGQLATIQKEINWVRGNNQLLEYTDHWGNPFVYIHNRDYGKRFKYMTLEGEIFEVQAQKNPVTGSYYAPTTFQLWSIGIDGKNQNGGDHDIASWN